MAAYGGSVPDPVNGGILPVTIGTAPGQAWMSLYLLASDPVPMLAGAPRTFVGLSGPM
jgi:hypothetical protein